MTEDVRPVKIGMVLFPRLTALDLVGPYEVLTASQSSEVALLWHRMEPVAAVGGLAMMPTATFGDYGHPDVLFVPGGPGQLEAMEDEALLQWLRDAAPHARFVTSVCTGSLVLAAAGLLVGRRATCHWASMDQLPLLGAIPVRERVVRDGNFITGAGVTSGVDFALAVAAELWGEKAAKRIQLLLEYDPEPPGPGGTEKTADPAMVAAIRKVLGPVTEKRMATAARIGRDRLGLGS